VIKVATKADAIKNSVALTLLMTFHGTFQNRMKEVVMRGPQLASPAESMTPPTAAMRITPLFAFLTFIMCNDFKIIKMAMRKRYMAR